MIQSKRFPHRQTDSRSEPPTHHTPDVAIRFCLLLKPFVVLGPCETQRRRSLVGHHPHSRAATITYFRRAALERPHACSVCVSSKPWNATDYQSSSTADGQIFEIQ